jgi:hypothetical protein
MRSAKRSQSGCPACDASGSPLAPRGWVRHERSVDRELAIDELDVRRLPCAFRSSAASTSAGSSMRWDLREWTFEGKAICWPVSGRRECTARASIVAIGGGPRSARAVGSTCGLTQCPGEVRIGPLAGRRNQRCDAIPVIELGATVHPTERHEATDQQEERQ